MKTKTWLRLYHEFADDPKIQMLAFEDQRHYVMVLCLKGRGVLDSNTPTADYRERMIAKALGLDPLTSREVKFRLMEPGLIDENWQPVKWAERQFESDNSTERVQKYREKRKRFGNVSSKQDAEPGGQLVNRDGNVSVTAQIRSDQSREENSPPGNSLSAKSADGRANPSGSPAASDQTQQPKPRGKATQAPEPVALDPVARVWHWSSIAWKVATRDAELFGLLIDGQTIVVSRGTSPVDLPRRVRDELTPIVRSAAEAATAEEIEAKLAYPVIDARLTERMKLEMRAYRPATASERHAAVAA